MPLSRHQARMLAVQTLYEWEFRPNIDIKEAMKRNLKEDDGENLKFAIDLAEGTIKNIKEIDQLITASAPEWPIEQIAILDKIILRLATCELLFIRKTPPKVVIDEAVELAKTFGGENSSKFVNGALGTIYRNSDLYVPEEEQK